MPDSVPRFREVFGEFARMAEGEGVRLAFENCLQGGNWERGETNMAFHPAAWDLMFDAVPSAALGLEWEPCHLDVPVDRSPAGAGPLFVRAFFTFMARMDNSIAALLASSGTHGPEPVVRHRFPGLGDTDWTVIFQKLAHVGIRGRWISKGAMIRCSVANSRWKGRPGRLRISGIAAGRLGPLDLLNAVVAAVVFLNDRAIRE